MSDITWDKIKEKKYEDACEDIYSMTVGDFQTLCEDNNIDDVVSELDKVIPQIAWRMAND